MDKLTKFILKYIVKNAFSEYVVFDLLDIKKEIPNKYKATNSDIIKSILSLQERGFVVLKYYDENVCCVMAETKGKLFLQNISEQENSNKTIKKYCVLSVVFSAIFSFLGAMIAVLLFL